MYRLLALAVVTVAVVVACDTVPLTSPTGSTITLSIDKNILPINGQATVTAVVTEVSGTAVHNGTVVTFQPSIGTVSPVEAKTVNGVATATFLAGALSGTGMIHAFSGPARTGSGNASGGVEVRIGAAAAGPVISVSATPPSVSQSGGTVTISALVVDTANNPLPGVMVIFTASSGALSATQALSDATGFARTMLTASQTTTVTATAGSATGRVDVVVSAPPSVSIKDVAPATPTAGQPVTFTVSTTSGNTSAPRQVQTLEVNFGDNTSETRSNVTGDASFTHTYQSEGGYTITARATDVAGNTGIASRAISIGFTPQPTATISATKNPVSMGPPDNGVVILRVTAAASSTTGAPIRDVRVTAQDGSVIYQNPGPVTAAEVPYRFTSIGTYTFRVTATDASGQTATASTAVFVTP